MATNFVAQEYNKLAFPAFIVFAGILQQLGRSQNLYSYQDPQWTNYIF